MFIVNVNGSKLAMRCWRVWLCLTQATWLTRLPSVSLAPARRTIQPGQWFDGRSSTLVSLDGVSPAMDDPSSPGLHPWHYPRQTHNLSMLALAWLCLGVFQDRKSTRLNSSHTVISYAVFCLKKKNKMLKGHSSVRPGAKDRVARIQTV